MANLLKKALQAIGFRNIGATSPEIDRMLQAQIDTYINNNYAIVNSVVPVVAPYSDSKAVRSYAGDSASVYIIVSKKIQMAANIPLYEYVIKDKKSFLKYKQLTSGDVLTVEGLQMASFYKEKAMEQVNIDSDINKLLQNPNGYDTQFEFLEKVYGFLDLTGEAFMWKQRLSMGANAGKVVGLHTLPSRNMKVIPDGRRPVGVGGWIFDLYGEIGLQPDEIIQVKYFNPIWDSNNCQLRGLSPIQAGGKILLKNNAAIDGEISSFRNGGPPMIIYREDEHENITPEQAGLLKQRFINETSGVDNINKIMLSSGKLGAIHTGISPVDQNILESSKFSFQELCGLFKMPPEFYYSLGSSTFNNQDAYKKSAYTEGAIPMVMRVRDRFNKDLIPAGSNSFIDADLSNIPVLQQDMKTLSEWLNMSPEITLNERREMKGQDRLPDPNMDKVYIPSGWTPLDDVNIQPVDLSQQTIQDTLQQ